MEHDDPNAVHIMNFISGLIGHKLPLTKYQTQANTKVTSDEPMGQFLGKVVISRASRLIHLTLLFLTIYGRIIHLQL
jgi:hypothetical protein